MIGRFADDGLAPGQRYAVRRLQGDPKAFPRQGDGFGAVRTAGWVTVTAVNEWNARAVVDLACDGINPGDYLDLYTEPALPTTASEMMPPDFSDRANVLEGTDAKGIFGDGDTLSINRGTAHGVVAGARYAFYRDRYDGKDGMPLFHLGDGVVVELGEQTSKVVVVKTVDADHADRHRRATPAAALADLLLGPRRLRGFEVGDFLVAAAHRALESLVVIDRGDQRRDQHHP